MWCPLTPVYAGPGRCGRTGGARMTIGHTGGMVGDMTAKVTLSFSDDTIAEARRFAQREGLSLSAWMDRAAREKALRELFGAHADAVSRAAAYSGLDLEAAALADERESAMVHRALFGAAERPGGERRDAGRRGERGAA